MFWKESINLISGVFITIGAMSLLIVLRISNNFIDSLNLGSVPGATIRTGGLVWISVADIIVVALLVALAYFLLRIFSIKATLSAKKVLHQFLYEKVSELQIFQLSLYLSLVVILTPLAAFFLAFNSTSVFSEFVTPFSFGHFVGLLILISSSSSVIFMYFILSKKKNRD